jgi:protein required for attachment to host cells
LAAAESDVYDAPRLSHVARKTMLRSRRTAFATFDGATAAAYLYERANKKLTPLDGFPMSGAKKPEFQSKPGRVFQSFSERRSAAEPPSDPEKELERRFVAEVAAKLDALRVQNAFERIIVAAGPRALGYWRDVAPKELSAVVTKELASDYSNTDPQALVQIVENAFFE